MVSDHRQVTLPTANVVSWEMEQGHAAPARDSFFRSFRVHKSGNVAQILSFIPVMPHQRSGRPIKEITKWHK